MPSLTNTYRGPRCEECTTRRYYRGDDSFEYCINGHKTGVCVVVASDVACIVPEMCYADSKLFQAGAEHGREDFMGAGAKTTRIKVDTGGGEKRSQCES